MTETHPIQAYLDSQPTGSRVTQESLASRVGLSKQQINNVVRGRSRLSMPKALAVVTATGGKVTLEDLAAFRLESDTEPETAASGA